MAYLSYSEPSITTILSLTSFLLLLNISRCALDYLFHCGLIAEVLIGVIWGLPIGGTKLLDEGTQRAIQSFGFLGLTGLVFEGGLSTDLALLRRTVYMSVSIATMGLLMPIALSFILLSLPFTVGTSIKYPTPLAAFSAGASLCSTSLGTTFAMLSSANLQRTSVGVVLVGAAIMDDVVGLVMVNIIKTLGNGKTAGWGIAKPIVASFILLLVTLAVVIALLKPACRWVFRIVNQSQALVTPQNSTPSPTVQNTIKKHLNSMPHLGFIASILILIIFVSIASVIGASVLFAAFIAGGVVNSLASIQDDSGTTQSESNTNLSKMYEQYYKPAMDFILIPFFFASIGFSIPIKTMFTGQIVWKGILYSVLMTIAKGSVSSVVYIHHFVRCLRRRKRISRKLKKARRQAGRDIELSSAFGPQTIVAHDVPDLRNVETITATPIPHPIALLIGFAMVARGEIGFLIASLSQSTGTLELQNRDESLVQSPNDEVFLVIIWAVVLCTIAGPLGVGIIVKKASSSISAAWL